MKFCTKCGAQMEDNTNFCPACGAKVNETVNTVNNTADNSGSEALQLIAKVFMILSTIGLGILILPLCWMVPMTVHYFHVCEKHEKPGIGFMICTMLFVDLISGILMLIDSVQ